MARPKKETVEYFPHYVNSGKTLFILEQAYGNDGYAFWFKLLELLGSTDGHVYDCRNTPSWRFLLAKTHVSEVISNEILNTLVELEAIDKECWENRLIWSDNFVRNLLPLYSNRKGDLPKKPVISGRNDVQDEFQVSETLPTGITTGEKPQSKVKESKVKESKDKEEEKSLSDKTFEILKFYENKTCVNISAQYQLISSLVKIYNIDDIKEAVTKALDCGKKGKSAINYAKGILKNWTTEGKEEQHKNGQSKQVIESKDRDGIGIEI